MTKTINNHNILISCGNNPNIFDEYLSQSSEIEGIITINGLFDYALDIGNTNNRDYEITRSLKSVFDDLSKISLLNYVDEIKCPVLIVHEIDNEDISVIQSEAFFTAVKDRNPDIPCELLLLKKPTRDSLIKDFLIRKINSFADSLSVGTDEKDKDDKFRINDPYSSLYLSYTRFPFKRDKDFGYTISENVSSSSALDFYNFRLPSEECSEYEFAYDKLFFIKADMGDMALFCIETSQLNDLIYPDSLDKEQLSKLLDANEKIPENANKLSFKYDNFYNLKNENGVLTAWYTSFDTPSIKTELDNQGKIRRIKESIQHNEIFEGLLTNSEYEIHIEEILTDNAQGWLLYDESFKKNKKYPLLTVVHGGPNGFYTTGYSDEFMYYLQNGYLVLFSNPRGGDGYDSEHDDPEHAWNGDFLKDIEEIVYTAVDRFSFIDKDRIGITGGSYGGYAAIYALENSSIFKSGCALRPFANFHMIGSCSQSAGGNAKKTDYADYLDYLLECNENSLVSFADKIIAPLLIIQSENDANCIPQQMKQLFYVMKKLNKDVDLLMLPESNHSLMSKGPKVYAQKAYRSIIDFFKKTLQ